MLKIEHLTKKYGDKKAVDDLTLTIGDGEIYGFIGHNGAGKTTTIKACCGIMNFDSGEIYIDGISIKDQPLACKKLVAYIPDNPRSLRIYDRNSISQLCIRHIRRAAERPSGEN